jgi:hypothetical protein
MNRLEGELPVVCRKSSEIYFVEQPTLVATVLGCCVAITRFNSRADIGMICLVIRLVAKANDRLQLRLF